MAAAHARHFSPIEAAGEELHPSHYLMLLLKRHLVGLYSTGRAEERVF
jgi:hypothetical protein